MPETPIELDIIEGPILPVYTKAANPFISPIAKRRKCTTQAAEMIFAPLAPPVVTPLAPIGEEPTQDGSMTSSQFMTSSVLMSASIDKHPLPAAEAMFLTFKLPASSSPMGASLSPPDSPLSADEIIFAPFPKPTTTPHKKTSHSAAVEVIFPSLLRPATRYELLQPDGLSFPPFSLPTEPVSFLDDEIDTSSPHTSLDTLHDSETLDTSHASSGDHEEEPISAQRSTTRLGEIKRVFGHFVRWLGKLSRGCCIPPPSTENEVDYVCQMNETVFSIFSAKRAQQN